MKQLVKDAILKLVGGDQARADAFIALVDDTNREIVDQDMIRRSLPESTQRMVRVVSGLSEGARRKSYLQSVGVEPAERPYNTRNTPRLSQAPGWLKRQDEVRDAVGRSMASIAGGTLSRIPLTGKRQ